MVTKNIYCVIIVAFLSLLPTAPAKVLYVVSHGGELYSFDIDYLNEELVYRQSLSLGTQGGYGPIDLAVDEDSNTLFVSFEACNVLTVVDTETMTVQFNHQFAGLDNLTGIVYDKPRSRILGTLRNTNRLYIINWDAQTQYLTPEPQYVELEGINYACGVSLDGDMLYVSKYYYYGAFYDTVYVYDVSNNFELVKTIDLDVRTVGIAYSTLDDALYGGAYDDYETGLVKFTEDPNTIIKKPLSSISITGLACDEEVSGSLFTSSYSSIMMWNTSEWTDDPNQQALPLFTYDNSNNDNVALGGLAGCAIGGTPKERGGITITVTNDVLSTDDVSPLAGDKNVINFTVTVDPNGFDHTDVIAEVRLPRGLSLTMETVLACLDPNAVYLMAVVEDADFSWDLGDIDANDPPIVLELEAFVTTYAQPNGQLVSNYKVETSTHYSTDIDIIDVSCWGGDTIYVDDSAGLYGSGTSWRTAYKDLRSALARAEGGCGTTVKVAKGTYKPYGSQSDAFVIPDGVVVEGGYDGYYTQTIDPDYRDIRLNATILTGDNYNRNVVIMGDGSTLDGFVIKNATQDAIKNISTGDSVNIYNCRILNSGSSGILMELSSCLIINTDIKDNSLRGIDLIATDESIMSGIIVKNNLQDGVRIIGGRSDLSNSIIANNGGGTTYKGVKLTNVSSSSLINNCTISNNANTGIEVTGTNIPEVVNSIFWKNGGNTGFYTDLVGLSVSDCSYSCFTDPNDPNSIDTTADQYNNIHSNPGMLVEDIRLGNFHLAPGSPCIGIGDGLPSGDFDVDNEDRIVNTTLDIGADEYKAGVMDNICDFDKSGNIDLADLAIFADCYGSNSINDPNHNYNPICNLETVNTPTTIAEDDLFVFLDNWLWEAEWFTSRYATPQTMQMMIMFSPPQIVGTAEKQIIVNDAAKTAKALNILASFPDFENKAATLELLGNCLERLEQEYNE